jgi:hypothetical protein
MTKRICLILAFVLTIAVFTPIAYWYYSNSGDESDTPIFFGVSFGGETVSEAKLLIDKVKDYTNLFLVNSISISTNETALNEVCEYAATANLDFIVFFGYISRIVYPWHQEWLDSAKERWGDNFLGVYLFDEPGGRQIDKGNWTEEMPGREEIAIFFKNVSDYSDAANAYVSSISSQASVVDLEKRNISMFTSDYALYWFDYMAGYDTVFAELAWNHSRPQQIGLCRGAANVQGKDWGTMITWTYDQAPFLANGTEILEDMLTAYEAGAKYIVVFNHPVYPENNPYGVLTDDHFWALQTFWKYIHENPEDYGKSKGQVAFVLPKDYGWGMRWSNDSIYGFDSIWGLWPADNQSSVIWDKMNKLIENYGFTLDIVYEDPSYNYLDDYTEVYYWYSDIN